jgi:hypothetical protein
MEQRRKAKTDKAEGRKVEMAEKRAQKGREKQESNSKKPVKQPQLSKRKALAAPVPDAKRVRQFANEGGPIISVGEFSSHSLFHHPLSRM